MGKKFGFTLIELLIVIVILGVMALIGLSSFSGSKKKARDAERKSSLHQIKNALQLYYNVYGQYPLNDGDYKIVGCGDDPEAATSCNWDSEWSRETNVFMKKLPADPASSQGFVYTQDGPENYYLIANLETADDPDIAQSQALCGVGSGIQYAVCED
ncbi:MAG TPA: type II secretion system protein [Candidatus Bathyarchaeia archaeon]|nr:type II secretion system protein [Candidatus Bathyarchaeia archaeon]